jgi:ubiquinone/menaquinone biosynthesis C-methylase UbiE
MKLTEKDNVCSVEHAGALDLKIRRLFHNPEKIVRPYIIEGMTVLDVGCGPGYFTLEMARLAGNMGNLVAVDLQEGMLEIVKKKINKTSLENNIELHQCQKNEIGLTKKFDFILVFWMLHETPDINLFLKELYSLLKPAGKILIAEPNFHVSKKEFIKSKMEMSSIGFKIIEEPHIFFSRSVVLSKNII